MTYPFIEQNRNKTKGGTLASAPRPSAAEASARPQGCRGPQPPGELTGTVWWSVPPTEAGSIATSSCRAVNSPGGGGAAAPETPGTPKRGRRKQLQQTTHI